MIATPAQLASATSSSALLDQALATATGLLLLTAVLQLWRKSLNGSIALLAIQGGALAALVAVVARLEGEPELALVAVLVFAIKAVAIPVAMRRTADRVHAAQESTPRINPTAGLLWSAALMTIAYLAARPLVGIDPTPLQRSVPVGLALVLLGFLILLTRRLAISQMVGFVVLDNGIATITFLTAGGVPLVVEFGVMLDVLLVVLILTVLTDRMRSSFGHTDLDDLRELRD